MVVPGSCGDAFDAVMPTDVTVAVCEGGGVVVVGGGSLVVGGGSVDGGAVAEIG
jgi:hypothetical protein